MILWIWSLWVALVSAIFSEHSRTKAEDSKLNIPNSPYAFHWVIYVEIWANVLSIGILQYWHSDASLMAFGVFVFMGFWDAFLVDVDRRCQHVGFVSVQSPFSPPSGIEVWILWWHCQKTYARTCTWWTMNQTTKYVVSMVKPIYRRRAAT